MSFVLDASVTLAWVFEDEVRPDTDSLMDRLRDEMALVPAIWVYEIANALAVGQRRKKVTEVKAQAFAELLSSLPIEVAPPRPIVMLMALAARHGLSAYDAAYLDLAASSGAPLATLDERLRSAAREAGIDDALRPSTSGR